MSGCLDEHLHSDQIWTTTVQIYLEDPDNYHRELVTCSCGAYEISFLMAGPAPEPPAE